MQNSIETSELLISMRLEMNMIKVKLELTRRLISQNYFDEAIWLQTNWGGLNSLKWHANEYEKKPNHNIVIIHRCRENEVFWKSLIDLFVTETMEWVQENIEFLNIQIRFLEEMIQVCTETLNNL